MMINFRVRILKLASPLDGTKAIKEKKHDDFWSHDAIKPCTMLNGRWASWPEWPG